MSAVKHRSSFIRAAGAGSVLALVIDILMLSDGHLSLSRQMGFLGSFYDAQGRALLHGHLAVPAASASFEGFVIGGRTYTYFGLVPAILRLPILLVTHALDGRLTQLSMLLALIVLLVSGARAHWHVRELIRPGEPLGRAERAAVFLIALALGAGVPLFLVSWPVVYQEAELWGAALALAAVDGVLLVIERPTRRRIAWAGALSVLAINTRVSVGLGPVIALGILGLGLVARAIADSHEGSGPGARMARKLAALGPARPADSRRMAVFLAVAVVLAIGSYAAVNEAKFGSAFGIPFAAQVNTQVDPMQRLAVAANHGTLLGPKFLPTTLLAAVRPDALGVVRAFPFIGLPDSLPKVVGSVRFIALLPSLSAFTAMPLFCLLLLAGLPGLVRRRTALPLIGVLVATAAGFGATLSFASVATRYLADALPCLVLGSCAGLQVLVASSRMRSRAALRATVGAMAILTLAGIIINGSVGIVQQRLLAPTTSMPQRAAFVRAQDDVDRFLGRRPTGIHTGSQLPTRSLGPLGDLFILGRCAGLYVESFGGTWLPVERSGRSGLYELNVRFPTPRSVTVHEVLLSLREGARTTTVVVQGSDGKLVFSVEVAGRTVATGTPIAVVPGRPTPVTVSIDPLDGSWFLSVQLTGARTVVTARVPYDRLATETVGADPSDRRLVSFSGTIARVPETTPICLELARRAGLL